MDILSARCPYCRGIVEHFPGCPVVVEERREAEAALRDERERSRLALVNAVMERLQEQEAPYGR